MATTVANMANVDNDETTNSLRAYFDIQVSWYIICLSIIECVILIMFLPHFFSSQNKAAAMISLSLRMDLSPQNIATAMIS